MNVKVKIYLWHKQLMAAYKKMGRECEKMLILPLNDFFFCLFEAGSLMTVHLMTLDKMEGLNMTVIYLHLTSQAIDAESFQEKKKRGRGGGTVMSGWIYNVINSIIV